jgi:ComF family protein
VTALNRFSRILRRTAKDAMAVLLPFRCAACGNLPAAAPDGVAAPTAAAGAPLLAALCPDCRNTVQPVVPPLCRRCGRPFTAAGGNHRCGACDANPPPVARMRAAAVYDGAMVDLVRRFKYHRAAHLAAPMGRWLAEVYGRDWQHDPVDMVVPVPLHRRRIHQRGYNQAWLLVREAFSSRQPGDAPSLRRDLIIRVRDTPAQAGLDSRQRRQNLSGAFHVVDRSAVADNHLLVVDDVATTGETIAACAQTLTAAGARRVDALTLARTSRRNS